MIMPLDAAIFAKVLTNLQYNDRKHIQLRFDNNCSYYCWIILANRECVLFVFQDCDLILRFCSFYVAMVKCCSDWDWGLVLIIVTHKKGLGNLLVLPDSL